MPVKDNELHIGERGHCVIKTIRKRPGLWEVIITDGGQTVTIIIELTSDEYRDTWRPTVIKRGESHASQ